MAVNPGNSKSAMSVSRVPDLPPVKEAQRSGQTSAAANLASMLTITPLSRKGGNKELKGDSGPNAVRPTEQQGESIHPHPTRKRRQQREASHDQPRKQKKTECTYPLYAAMKNVQQLQNELINPGFRWILQKDMDKQLQQRQSNQTL